MESKGSSGHGQSFAISHNLPANGRYQNLASRTYRPQSHYQVQSINIPHMPYEFLSSNPPIRSSYVSQTQRGAVYPSTLIQANLQSHVNCKFYGVTRRKNYYEASIWGRLKEDKPAKLVYIGSFKDEVEAARAYDLVAIKFYGASVHTNFPYANYADEVKKVLHLSAKEYVQKWRSECELRMTRTTSKYQGVSRSCNGDRWYARLARVGNLRRTLYLGSFNSEDAAARAYDIASIRFNGPSAFTNFNITCYNVEKILNSEKLPLDNGASKRIRDRPFKELWSSHARLNGRRMLKPERKRKQPKEIQMEANGRKKSCYIDLTVGENISSGSFSVSQPRESESDGQRQHFQFVLVDTAAGESWEPNSGVESVLGELYRSENVTTQDLISLLDKFPDTNLADPNIVYEVVTEMGLDLNLSTSYK